jgi:hypothetical protein
VAAPFEATSPITKPVLILPDQYEYSSFETGADWPDGVKYVAGMPRESWLIEMTS